MSVPDGCYPRLNSAMCLSNKYDGSLVSVVGRYYGHAQQFQCCDGGTIQLLTEHIEQPGDLDVSGQGMAFELIGQWMDNRLVAFVSRELSLDMDLSVYEKMIQVQQHPKYQHYFSIGTQQ